MKDESIQQQRPHLHMLDEGRDSRFVLPDRERKLIAARSFHARARFVLGEEWRARFAQALQCSPARFNSPPQPIVEAVLELLELALNNGICTDQNLPPRWNISALEIEPVAMRARFANLLGENGLAAVVASAVGLSIDRVRLAWSGGSVRCGADLLSALELLELIHARHVPRDRWPVRWHSVVDRQASPLSARASGCEAKNRFRQVLGGSRLNARISYALELSPDYLGQVWREAQGSHGRPMRVQEYLVAVVELLETLKEEDVPIERWPMRWRIFPNQGR